MRCQPPWPDGAHMIQVNINIFRFRLRFQLTKKRPERGFIAKIIEDVSNIRTGSKISRFFRHILERSNIRALLGRNLVFLAVVSGIAAPAAGTSVNGQPEVNTITIADQPLSTEVVVQYPLQLQKINQGYRLFHPGVDFEGITGNLVKPIMKGVVAKTERSRFAYGNSVLVDHGNGHQSMYAHLSKIHVKAGEEVDTRSVVGEVGSTGRATGDHLHLEVYKEGKTVNPLTVLPR